MKLWRVSWTDLDRGGCHYWVTTKAQAEQALKEQLAHHFGIAEARITREEIPISKYQLTIWLNTHYAVR
jgi:hypothetical protein